MSLNQIVIVPGNGCVEVERANWYGWLQKQLTKDGITCKLESMPDPFQAQENIWIPFMRDHLKCDNHTLIVGHSSGAEAAMRFAESYPVFGIFLVSACVTDLGMESERASGYYSRPWEWSQTRNNSPIIVQFGSTDDPFIPWDEQQQVADGLNSVLKKYTDEGHFMKSSFPDLLKCIKEYI